MKIKDLHSPFLVFDGNDLMIFADMQTLQIKLEPIDIKDNVYQIFDSQGYLLKFIIKHVNQDTIFLRQKKMVEFTSIVKKDLSMLTYLLNNYYKILFKKPIDGNADITKVIEDIIYEQGYCK